MPGGTSMQHHATLKCLSGELDDRTIPPEGQPGQRQIRQIGENFDLLQCDTQPDQHVEFAGSYVLSGQTGKSQILAIEFCHRERIEMPLSYARQKRGEFGDIRKRQ